MPLLRHVSGLNQLVAREIVDLPRDRTARSPAASNCCSARHGREAVHRRPPGSSRSRTAPTRSTRTWIHPESYPSPGRSWRDLGFSPTDLRDRAKLEELRGKLGGLNLAELAAKLGIGEPTVRDILDALARPGRDPREDLPPPIFKKGVLKLEDITAGDGVEGHGAERRAFGAFVDIGLKESGLVHISQMANRYIKSPYDVVAVGDVVTVWVMEVKPGEKKISLSMIPPARRGSGGPRRSAARPGSGCRGTAAAAVPEQPQGPPRGERPAFPRGGQGPGGADSCGPGGAGGRGPGARPPQGTGAVQRVNRPPNSAPQPPPPPTRRSPQSRSRCRT